MKYLVVLLVVLAVVWIVRTSGRRDGSAAPGAASARREPGKPQDMVECPVCSVHLPRTDALPGPGGRLYCCAEHRARAGG